MNPDKTMIIFGPPGTGKTTNLLSTVWSLIEEGIAPKDICFIAFTRKAAQEARVRAAQQFSLEDEELRWFRTMHSLAFQQLNSRRDQVMGIKDYLNLCNELGLIITTKLNAEEGTFGGLTRGDKLFFAENMARAKMVELKEYWDSIPDEDIAWYELKRLRESLENYKKANDKVDYTDIIYGFIGRGVVPNFKALIIDEAQDLSALQWKMADKLAESAERVFVAGDDDQAIFRWAGADTGHLIELGGERKVLGQSYRVPKKVQEVALSVVGRIEIRVPKVWSSRNTEGVVDYISDVTEIEMNNGTWLLLARNGYMLDYYVQHCLREGLIFEAPDSPISSNMFRAIIAWEKLRAGETVPVSLIKHMYDLMTTRVGVTYGFKGKFDELPDKRAFTLQELKEHWGLRRQQHESWDIVLDKMPAVDVEYFSVALQKGERLQEPRIRISTIHSVKGAEADNVVLQLDMADRTWNEYTKFPDDEHRVWYVAVTRAKERLVILSPKTNKSYPL